MEFNFTFDRWRESYNNELVYIQQIKGGWQALINPTYDFKRQRIFRNKNMNLDEQQIVEWLHKSYLNRMQTCLYCGCLNNDWGELCTWCSRFFVQFDNAYNYDPKKSERFIFYQHQYFRTFSSQMTLHTRDFSSVKFFEIDGEIYTMYNYVPPLDLDSESLYEQFLEEYKQKYSIRLITDETERKSVIEQLTKGK